MGSQASTTSSERNPNSSPTAGPTSAAMPSSDSPQSHESRSQSAPTHDPKALEIEARVVESLDPTSEENPEDLALKKDDAVREGEGEGEGEEGEEEEEGECGFCLFMKGGGCKEVFTDWEKCVEEGEAKKEDIVEKCFEITANLKKCMEAHADYYGPLLQAEKAAQEEARKELEKEKTIEESASDKDGVLPVSEQNKEDGS